MTKIDTIIFDLGGVLIDWSPKYVYRKVFNGDEEKVEWFLNNICTMDWNMEQDAGRTWQEATDLLIKQHPEYKEWIQVYADRWEEMLGGPIQETVHILDNLKTSNTCILYALTNWSAETFPIALKRFDFLQHFKGIVVSGEEKTRKPFTKIYEIILDRYNINPEKAIFIDDNLENIITAKSLGIHGIHFKNASQLKTDLEKFNIIKP
ncbi:MAG TPA: HAD family hydrolase [Flavobacteriaceae bacterium]|nr:HAD family hydrolase [Flavobacteriaceae bacterium]